jgi:transposase InsO family protein
MDGGTVSLAAQTTVEWLPKGEDGRPRERPEVRSDNGSRFIAKEFRQVLAEQGLGPHRITPHCPAENGLVERVALFVPEWLKHFKDHSCGWLLPRIGWPVSTH